MKNLLQVTAKGIRHFTRADIPAVAEMYRQVFPSPAGLSYGTEATRAALAEIFFDNPWYDEEIASLVYLNASEQVMGFLGVTARPMLFKGRPVRGAVSAHFMSAPGGQNQLAGLQLLKAFFNGPQDFSLTDAANHAGRRVWEGLGGLTSPGYSFHWTKVLRPAEFAYASVAHKFPPLASLAGAVKPLCRLVNLYLTRLMPYRFSLPSSAAATLPLDAELLAAGLEQCTASDALRPAYSLDALAWLLRRAARIQQFGELQQVAVRNARGELLGWYLYYLRPAGESRVLQLAARRHALPEIFDHLCQHAWQRGAVALNGRVEPKYLSVLADRHCCFTSGKPWFQVHSHNAEVLQALLSGDAFLTSLDGEWCTSIRGL